MLCQAFILRKPRELLEKQPRIMEVLVQRLLCDLSCSPENDRGADTSVRFDADPTLCLVHQTESNKTNQCAAPRSGQCCQAVLCPSKPRLLQNSSVLSVVQNLGGPRKGRHVQGGAWEKCGFLGTEVHVLVHVNAPAVHRPRMISCSSWSAVGPGCGNSKLDIHTCSCVMIHKRVNANV